MSTGVQLRQPVYFWSGSTLSFFPATSRLLKDHTFNLWINNNPNVHVILTYKGYTKIRGTVKLRISHLCTAIGTVPYTHNTALPKPQSPNNSVVHQLSPMGNWAVAGVDSLKKWGDQTQKSESTVARLQMCIMNVKEWKIYIKSNA